MNPVQTPPRQDAAPRTQPAKVPRKRMLIIVNPYATTVSDRLKNLVVYALQGRFDVEAVSTEAQNHATEIGREARDGGYDVVVAFGGDGTVNEVANGLAGTDVPVTALPGGSTNVVCRTLGIPNDVVDATEHLLGLADELPVRRIDLGVANGRRFVFACGAGIDATAAGRVDANPRLKTRLGPYFYTWAAVSGFYRGYLRNPVRMRVRANGSEQEGITAIVQNSDPFSWFRNRPLHVCRGVALDDGTLAIATLRRGAQRDLPFIAARILVERLGSAARHPQVAEIQGITGGRIESVSSGPAGAPRPFPVEMDGEYIGEHTTIELGIEPGALAVVA